MITTVEGYLHSLALAGQLEAPVVAHLYLQAGEEVRELELPITREAADDMRIGHPVWLHLTNQPGQRLAPDGRPRDIARDSRLVLEAIDLLTRVSAKDPLQPAITRWLQGAVGQRKDTNG